MKVKPEHLEQLRKGVERALSEQPGALQSYLDAGLTVMRFRWDALWYAVRRGYVEIDGETRNPIGVLYRYGCNDSHVDTALRRITGTT